MTALAVDRYRVSTTQLLPHQSLLVVPLISQSCYANGATDLSNGTIRGSYYKEMRKINQIHCASVVARVIMDRARALGRGARPKIRNSLPTSYSQLEAPRCALYASGEANEAAQSASTPGDFRVTRKQQSCHKVVAENWNHTSIIRKEHKLVEEAKQYSMDVIAISSTMCHGANTVKLGNVWKLFYSSIQPVKFTQPGMTILGNSHLATCVNELIPQEEKVCFFLLLS